MKIIYAVVASTIVVFGARFYLDYLSKKSWPARVKIPLTFFILSSPFLVRAVLEAFGVVRPSEGFLGLVVLFLILFIIGGYIIGVVFDFFRK